MQGRGPQGLHGVAVHGGDVPHVAIEPISRVCPRSRATHKAITYLLGNHRCRGNGGARGVALDHLPMDRGRGPQIEPINQADVGYGIEGTQGVGHEAHVRAMQAIAIDRGGAGRHHHDLLGVAHHCRCDLSTNPWAEALGVVQPGEVMQGNLPECSQVETHRRRHKGPRQTATPGLVGPRDSLGTQRAVVVEEM